MRPVEIQIFSKGNPATYEFRSVRTAYEFVEDSLENIDPQLKWIRSRVYVSNSLTRKWLLFASDTHRSFLIRLKPTSNATNKNK